MKRLIPIAILILSITYAVMAANAPRNIEVVEVVAKPGDTAWKLCRQVNDESVDVREAVWYFKRLNGTTDIGAWDLVQVPVL